MGKVNNHHYLNVYIKIHLNLVNYILIVLKINPISTMKIMYLYLSQALHFLKSTHMIFY